MQKLNYSPNMVAKSMRNQRMPVVGIIVPDILYEPAGLFVRAAQQRLSHYGYTAAFFNTRQNTELTLQFIDLMKAQCAAGFLIIPDCTLDCTCFHDTHVIYIWEKPGLPDGQAYSLLKFDYCKGGALAAEYLLKEGCKKIAFIGDNGKYSSQAELFGSFRRALKQAGHDFDPQLHFPVDLLKTTAGIACLEERLLKNGLQFDGIFCGSQRLSIALLSVLFKHKISVPDQVKMIGYGELRMASYELLKFKAISENEEALAWKAVDALMDQIQNGAALPQTLSLDVQLV